MTKYYTVVLIIVISIFCTLVSCSKDDTPYNPAISYLTGEYMPTSKSYVLEATIDGEKVNNDAVVVFNTGDNKVASITFKNIIDGQKSVTIQNVTLNKDETQYNFNGSETLKNGKMLMYSGSIQMTGYDSNLLTITLSMK